jgi:predicted MFS family arabinose efflux permease
MLTRLAPPLRRSLVLLVLLVVYIFYQVDKLLYAPLLPSMASELHLSDDEVGLITGSAPTWMTIALAVPLALLADAWNRVFVLSGGLFLWSLFTTLSSLARGFPALFLCRIGVGMGEAACNAPAYSLLADYFSPLQRTRALAIYTMGIYIAEGISYSFGGWMAQAYSWRRALLVPGVAGMVFSVAVALLVPEPKNLGSGDEVGARFIERRVGHYRPVGEADGLVPGAESRLTRLLRGLHPVRDILVLFWRKPVLLALSGSAGMRLFSGYALGFWIVAFYDRVYEVPVEKIGGFLAVIIPVAGVIGTSAGGVVSDLWAKRVPRAPLLVAGTTLLAAAFPLSAALFASTYKHSLAWLFLSIVLSETWIAPAVSVVQRVTPAHMRGTSSSLYLFISSAMASFGTLVVGRINESSKDPKFIKYSLLYTVAAVYLASSIGFLATAWLYKPEMIVEEPASTEAAVHQHQHPIVTYER